MPVTPGKQASFPYPDGPSPPVIGHGWLPLAESDRKRRDERNGFLVESVLEFVIEQNGSRTGGLEQRLSREAMCPLASSPSGLAPEGPKLPALSGPCLYLGFGRFPLLPRSCAVGNYPSRARSARSGSRWVYMILKIGRSEVEALK